MLALTIPWTLVILTIAAIVCLIKKKWKTALLFAVVTLALNWWSECVSLRFRSNKEIKNEKAIIKIICFNIGGTSGDYIKKTKCVGDFIKQYQPDVIFIAEYDEENPPVLDCLLRINYPFSTFNKQKFFQYFYSKTPLFNSKRLHHVTEGFVGVYFCSTVIQGDTIDMYGCHFASNNYNMLYERHSIEDIKGQEGIFAYIKNIQTSGNRRKIEAETIVHDMSQSSHHAIVLGDMNDVGGSDAIRALEAAGLTDAWQEGGFGYGATIHYPLPYRIDHILYNEGLVLKGVKVIDTSDISDHNALVAVFDFRN